MKAFGKKYEGSIYIGLAIAVALVLICFSSSRELMAPNVESIGENTATVTAEVGALLKDQPSRFEMNEKGVYDAYSPEKLALATNHKVVLFFKADWCPSCQIADQTINKEFASIPQNLAILKVSYDTELKLRKKYGVTIQHTFVQVDSQGNLITKWLGSTSIGEIMEKVR
jgi:thiol-disulfide isomerase/thioredoxin